MEKLIQQGQERAEQLAETLLDSPVLENMARAFAQVRGIVDKRAGAALHLLGLPSHSDVEKVAEVLSRSGRKLIAVEMNLARMESLLSGMDARSPAKPAQAPAAPKAPTRPIRRAGAAKKRPAMAGKAPAKKAGGTAREGLLADLGSGKKKISEFALARRRKKPAQPDAYGMLAGFDPKKKKSRK